MQEKIIQIGSSKGVMPPNALVEQYNLKEDVEIIPTANGILIQSGQKKGSREGWEEQIKAVIEK